MASYKLGGMEEEVYRKLVLVCELEGERKVASCIWEQKMEVAS